MTAIKEMEDVERFLRLSETRQVLAQPHRRGDESDMVDSLGVFLRHSFREEPDTSRRCWEAAQMYIVKVSRLRRVKGIPQKVFIVDETPSGGGELDDSIVAAWETEIKGCEDAMKCSGLSGFRAAKALVLEDETPPEGLYGPVKRSVFELAVCLGFFGIGRGGIDK